MNLAAIKEIHKSAIAGLGDAPAINAGRIALRLIVSLTWALMQEKPK